MMLGIKHQQISNVEEKKVFRKSSVISRKRSPISHGNANFMEKLANDKIWRKFNQSAVTSELSYFAALESRPNYFTFTRKQMKINIHVHFISKISRKE